MRAVSKAQLTPNEVCAILGDTAKEHFNTILSNKAVNESHNKYTLLYSKLDAYYSKCCYCESQLTGSEIEHYRPKSKNEYWWLVYSWDNLMPICPACNKAKSSKFPVLGQKISSPHATITELAHAQGLIEAYNKKEQPVLINPEHDTIPEDAFVFTKNGAMQSAKVGDRFDITIEEIGLDRDELNTARKAILDDFYNEIANYIIDKSVTDKETFIKNAVKQFKRRANDEQQTFTAFRKYAVKHFLKMP